jgi:hypothetical protein
MINYKPIMQAKKLADILTVAHIAPYHSKMPARAPNQAYLCDLRLGDSSVSGITVATLTPATVAAIREHSIYGHEPWLDSNHYVELVQRDDGRVGVWMKFQHIIGSWLLAELPRSAVKSYVKMCNEVQQ